MQVAILIMAGGRGERVWPIGRKDKPKQFLKIKSENTLIEETIIRAKTFSDEKNIFIITGEQYKNSLNEILPNFPKENIIFEPSKRDTAAAIAYGTYIIEQRIGEDVVVITLSSDHFIENVDLFTAVMKETIKYASENDMAVTVGITPNRAETGYGYIHTAECISEDSNKIKTYKVDSFVEKPNIEKAEIIYKDPSYLWNSGMFIWKSSVILGYIKKLEPSIYDKIVNTYKYISSGDSAKALAEFDTVEKRSIDFMVMEKIDASLCVKGDFVWDDVGSFSALSRIYTPDNNGNIQIGDNHILDSENTTIVNEDKDTFIAICGMKDIIVVNHKGATLIYPKGKDDMIKTLIAELEGKDKTEHL